MTISVNLSAAIALECLYQRFMAGRPSGAAWPRDRYSIVEFLRLEDADFSRWGTAANAVGRVEYYWR